MKIARNSYASFENSEYGNILRMDDLFVVTPEFEENPAFIEGLRVGAFEFVEIESMGQLNKVIDVTDEMKEEFASGLVVEPEDSGEDKPEEAVQPEETVVEKPDFEIESSTIETFTDYTETEEPEPPQDVEVEEAVEEAVQDAVDEAVEESKEEESEAVDSEADEDEKGEEEQAPTLDDKTYGELQTYAKVIEEKYDVQINRSQKFPDLKAAIEKVLEENK